MPRIDYSNKHGIPDERKFSEVVFPIASIGQCKNWRRCEQFKVELGNGYCVDCFDKGLDKKFGAEHQRPAYNRTGNSIKEYGSGQHRRELNKKLVEEGGV